MSTRTLQFHKSSYSADGAGECVEVDPCAGAVRDSKDPTGPVLMVSPGQWAAFARAAADGSDQFVC